jgi:Zn-finger nucleic acid-binding protein
MKLVVDKIYYICEYCGVTYYPQANPDGVRSLGAPSQYGCPLCDISLSLAAIGETAVLYCERCRGVLIPALSFATAIERRRKELNHRPVAPPPLNPKELERRILCPKCGKKMDTHPYGGAGNIVIDNCPRCKENWLDYHEFWRVTTAPEPKRKDESPLMWITPPSGKGIGEE